MIKDIITWYVVPFVFYSVGRYITMRILMQHISNEYPKQFRFAFSGRTQNIMY